MGIAPQGSSNSLKILPFPLVILELVAKVDGVNT